MRKQKFITRCLVVATCALLASCGSESAPAEVTVSATNTVAALNPTDTPRPVPPTATTEVAATATVAAPTTAAPTVAITRPIQTITDVPIFTHPTEITNPFYPVSLIGQSISLGKEGGEPYRTEVTLLPITKTVAWNGQQVEVRVSQYVAYANGKMVEVAYDLFAQADDGGVYYMGEEVTNYKDGKILNHDGSWQAGKDGAPPSLIMPAKPQVGQVFNPENLPGVVYETDEILSLSEKTTTPNGPIDNALLIKEILMDNSVEHKVNAANFGIVESRAEDEQINLVWLDRTDAKRGKIPDPILEIEVQAEDIFDAVPGNKWDEIAANAAAVDKIWQAYEKQATADHVPLPFQEALKAAYDRLQKAAAAKDAVATRQAANDLSAATMDIYTVFGPSVPVDIGRLDVLERQVVLDASAGDFTAAADSLAKTATVWERIKPNVLTRNSGPATAEKFDKVVAAQQEAINAANAAGLNDGAEQGLTLIDTLEGLF